MPRTAAPLSDEEAAPLYRAYVYDRNARTFRFAYYGYNRSVITGESQGQITEERSMERRRRLDEEMTPRMTCPLF